MLFRTESSIAATLCAVLLAASAPAFGQDDEAIGFELTPPRLSLADGEVSFWRPGAEEWTAAIVNIALAAGDELYAAEGANLEIQVGPRAFVRAGDETQLGLTTLEPDFLQLRVTTGHVSLDLRSLKAGETFELDTPNAAFTVEHTGYYRVEVDGETTTFISRRGGSATVTPAAGDSTAIAASEQVVVIGTGTPRVETYAAPELDAWDRWNYARTDHQIDALSARYVPSEVYGVDDLDEYGDWRLLPTYGPVWVPRALPVGWAPYSTGRWMYDPFYGWTWVDTAPWGWAPFHYGRWVYVSGFWGWCPGPVVARAYYAPALVAFFGGGVSVGISLPLRFGWVALGWGEPLIPWWGHARFRAAPRWAGWGGPRIVNDVVVKRTTVIQVRDINVYRNTRVRDAFVAVDRDHFGRRSVAHDRPKRVDPEKWEPVRGELPVKPDRDSLVAEHRPGRRPPRAVVERSVVATREPRVERVHGLEPRRAASPAQPEARGPRTESGPPDGMPPTRVVKPPREGRQITVSGRPPFGRQSEAERRAPPPAPRFRDERRRSEAQAAPPSEGTRERAEPAQTQRQGASRRSEEVSKPQSDLPGEPANRVYRQRSRSTPRADRSRRNGGNDAPAQERETRGPRRGEAGSR